MIKFLKKTVKYRVPGIAAALAALFMVFSGYADGGASVYRKVEDVPEHVWQSIGDSLYVRGDLVKDTPENELFKKKYIFPVFDTCYTGSFKPAYEYHFVAQKKSFYTRLYDLELKL